MALLEDVERELGAWIAARRDANVAEKLLAEAPEDAVLKAKHARATAAVQEATVLLKAALTAHGHSMADLQAQLRSG
jgi:hypothetical protein